MGIGCWEKKCQQNKYHRICLDRAVESQIACSARLAHVPLHHAAYADHQKDGKQPQTDAQTNAFCDERRYQRHEDDRHGQSVPHQPIVVRIEVIVSGTECSEKQADGNNDVEPAFSSVEKMFSKLLRAVSL